MKSWRIIYFSAACGLLVGTASFLVLGSELLESLEPLNVPKQKIDGSIFAVAAKVAPLKHRSVSQLPSGEPLSSLKVRGKPLALVSGRGLPFGKQQAARYGVLKEKGLSQSLAPIQWCLMDLDQDKILSRSKDAHLNMYGASVSKIYIGAALLHQQKGKLSRGQLQSLADMVVVSSNTAWAKLQRDLGDGNDGKGQLRAWQFSKALGHQKSIPFRGWHGTIHGNEVNPIEMTQLLSDTYWQRYDGAELLWPIMFATRTGDQKGAKYLPSQWLIGGKTGTYQGPTAHALTGKTYHARVAHHSLIIKTSDQTFGLTVMTDGLSSEDVAIMAYGLAKEHIEPQGVAWRKKTQSMTN